MEGEDANINRGLGDVDSNSNGWLWVAQDSVEEVNTDVVEIAR